MWPAQRHTVSTASAASAVASAVCLTRACPPAPTPTVPEPTLPYPHGTRTRARPPAQVTREAHIEGALKLQLFVSALLMTPVVWWLSSSFLPTSFAVSGACATPTGAFACVAFGLWGGCAIGFITEYYTSFSYRPVVEVTHTHTHTRTHTRTSSSALPGTYEDEYKKMKERVRAVRKRAVSIPRPQPLTYDQRSCSSTSITQLVLLN